MKRLNNLTFLIIVLIMMSSCVNTKKLGTAWVYKNQNVYKNFDDTSIHPSSDKLVTSKTKKGAKAIIEEKEDHIKINFLETPSLKSDTTKYDKAGRTYYYYPELKNELSTSKLKYMEMSSVFQAISTPFKIRGKVNDSIPYQVSKSVNLGLAYGWKFTHKAYNNYYSTDGTFLKKRTNSVSFVPAFFVGPTTVDLKPSNTNGKIDNERTVLGLNTGFMFVVGVNKLNLGVSGGWDFGFGSDAKNWIYQGEPWVGFVIGIDFIK